MTGHRVHYEERLRGLDSLLDSRYLLHHLLIHCQATRRIYNHNIVAIHTRLSDGFLRFLHGVALALARIDLGVYLLAQHAQLLDGCRTIHIARHQHHFLAFLRLQIVRQLAGEGCLTGALQTRHQDYRRRAFQVDFLCLAAHQRCQLVVGDFHHQLPGTNGGHHILPQCFGFHLVGKLLRGFVVHIGFQQSLADILHGFRYVNLGDSSFTLQNLKRAFQPLR